jgi:hypothetical protein
MQAPPAFSLSVSRFGAWRGLCLMVATAAVGVASAWAWAWFPAEPFTLLLPLLALAAAMPVCRAPAAFHLRWDSQGWFLDGRAGALAVAVDAGGGLLLWFVPKGARVARWLPVQRAGHEGPWHALRCTLHCARQPTPRPAADL